MIAAGEPRWEPPGRTTCQDFGTKMTTDRGLELLDPMDEINARRFPTVHRLAAGLAEDRWEGSSKQPWETCSTAWPSSWSRGLSQAGP